MMCNRCSRDPRDAIAEAEDALRGLRILVNEAGPSADLEGKGMGALLGLIHDRLQPAVEKLQDYVPRA